MHTDRIVTGLKIQQSVIQTDQITVRQELCPEQPPNTPYDLTERLGLTG